MLSPQKIEEYKQKLLKASWLGFGPGHYIRELAKDGSPAAIAALVEVVISDTNAKVKEAITGFLRNLTDAAIQDELCRLAIESASEEVMQLVLSVGCIPHDPGLRAVFFFLTGQFDKYDALDFDHSRLQTYYRLAEYKVRRKIAQKVSEAGREDYLNIIRDDQTNWPVIIEVLTRQKRWVELWNLIREAPPRYCKQILQNWPVEVWRPADPDAQATFDRLRSLALQCGSIDYPIGHLHNPPYTVNLDTSLNDYFNCCNHQHPYHIESISNDGQWLVLTIACGRIGYGWVPLIFKLSSGSWPARRVEVEQTVFATDTQTLQATNLFDLIKVSEYFFLKSKIGQAITFFRKSNGERIKLEVLSEGSYAVSPDNKIVFNPYDGSVIHLEVWDLTTNKLLTKLYGVDSDEDILILENYERAAVDLVFR